MIVDGLFFHPEGSTPKHVLDRMLDGTTNPRLDDIFAPALNASLAEVRKLAEQVQDAEDRLAVLEGAKQRAVELVAEQVKALKLYAETGEIDPILEPPIEHLAAAEVAKQDAEYKEDIEFKLPQELKDAKWTQKGPVRVTEYEEIVVLKRPRKEYSERVERVEERLSNAVKFAMQPFKTDGEHFHFMRRKIATRPQQSNGPPK